MAARRKTGTRRYGKTAGKSVKRAMRKRKSGTLKSGSGRKVRSREQAIAIGLNEAREAGAKVPRKRGAKKGGARKSSGRSSSGRSSSGRTSGGRSSSARKAAAKKGGRKTAAKKRARSTAAKKGARKRAAKREMM